MDIVNAGVRTDARIPVDQDYEHRQPSLAGELPSMPRNGVDMHRLIGRPHLFGRMKQLRNGFMVEPIALLTLQGDGRITGYGHPNEGSWKAYDHGEVDHTQAFAFISAHNRWIPSSTWTQSIGLMPVGHFCDEPEAVQAAQRLCLIPHEPNSDSSRIIYLVASCQNFYQHTVPILIEQLNSEGIPSDRIKVVVNASSRDESAFVGGVEYAFSTHDGWEWSALYEAPRRWQFEYAFLMHDTNVIFPGFRRSIEEFNRHITWEHLPASPLARCLLGLYSHPFLQRLNPWLKRMHKVSKADGIVAEASAELLMRARTALVLGDPETNGGARAAEWRETLDHFNTGQERVRRAFPAIKLHKFIHAHQNKPTDL